MASADPERSHIAASVGSFFRTALRSGFHRGAAVIAVSENTKQDLVSYFGGASYLGLQRDSRSEAMHSPGD